MDRQSHIKIEMLPQKFDGYFDKNMAEAQKQMAIAKAAPELLEALEAISSWTESAKCKREIGGLTHSKLLASCKSAIAKARGE